MRAIIYGYDIETNEWVELLNKGGFWAFINGIPFMVRRTMKISKKYKKIEYNKQLKHQCNNASVFLCSEV